MTCRPSSPLLDSFGVGHLGRLFQDILIEDAICDEFVVRRADNMRCSVEILTCDRMRMDVRGLRPPNY